MDSMEKLDEESLLERKYRDIPQNLEDVFEKFCEVDSEVSNILGNSQISVDFSISNTHEDSFNNKFKMNEIISNFIDNSHAENH